VKNYSFVPLQTNDSSLIGDISKILIYKSKAYILDTYHAKALKVFDLKGRFLYQIGNVGVGRGEYTMPFDFCINYGNDEISVLNANGSLLTYDANGKFVKDNPVENIGPFKCEINETGYAFIGGRRRENLILMNKNFEEKANYFPFIDPRTDKLLVDPIQKLGSNELIYRRNLNDTVYDIKNFSLSPRLVFNFKGQKITYEDIANHNASAKDISNAYRIKSFYETKDFIFTTFIYQDVFYLSLYSKATKNVDVLKYTSTKNDITFEKYSDTIIGADYSSNTLVFLVPPSAVVKAAEVIKNMPLSSQVSKMKELIPRVSLSSNPVLCFATLTPDAQ